MIRTLLLLVLLPGCIPAALVKVDHDSLEREIVDARARLRCAPRDLALAEANLAFTKVEFAEADIARAAEHVALGRKHAAVALACPTDAPAPVAPPPVTPVTPATPVVAVVTPAPASSGDADRDGVPDADDVCVNDPEDLDAFKDADGCPELDNDNDGVNDSADRCGSQAEDRDGFEDTDGCPDADNDRDGLADAVDLCPNEAGIAAEQGCASKDRDGDKISDASDQCPDAAETVNEYLDTDGCPDSKPSRVEVTGTQIVIKERINFATGKATILKDSFPVLNDVAQAMKDYPKIKVEIGGHTDNVGDDTGNQRLSKERADSVFEYLLGAGIPATRMVTIGYGETRPIDTNRTEEGKLNNRRVEFIIMGSGMEAPAPTSAPEPASPSPWQ